MDKETFLDNKEKLVDLINELLTQPNLAKHEENSLIKLLQILNQYSFENRLKMKGLLSHTIVDSLELDYLLGEKFIKFDADIR